MSGFAADWLALREPADRAARSATLIAAAAAHLAGREAPRVCDLGAGTGASVRAFGPVFPADTRWRLVDADPKTLARAAGPRIETRVVDLVADPAPWPRDCALVTATAFFDLAAPDWIGRLAAALARDRLPILSCLTYDGQIALAPDHPLDAAMIALFNVHQATDKGLGGRAAGPDAHGCLAAALKDHQFAVAEAATPWRLNRAAHGALIDEVLAGWARAAREIATVPDAQIAGWLADRLARTDAMTIGHADLFATPPEPS